MMKASPNVVMALITTTKNNWLLQRMRMVSSFLEISLNVGVERRIVIGILPRPQTFIMLTSKTQLFFAYLTLIPTG